MKKLFIFLIPIILSCKNTPLDSNWVWGVEDIITVSVTCLLLLLFIIYLLINIYKFFKK